MDERAKAVVEHLKAAHEEVMREQVKFAEIPCKDYRADERAKYLMGAWRAAGLAVKRDKVGNITAVIKGKSPKTRPTLILCAHVDSVFFDVEKIKVKRQGGKLHAPGICDDAAGVANLIVLARAISKHRAAVAGDVVLAGSVGEESVGKIWGMEYFWKTAKWREPWFVAIDGGTPGQVVRKALASWSPTVTVSGPGGHSFSHFGRPNPVHMLARLVSKVTTIKADRSKNAIYNANVIAGGKGVNIIPEEASVTINVRSSDMKELAKMRRRVEGFIREAKREELAWATRDRKLSVSVTAKGRPGGETAARHPLVKAAVEALAAEGLEAKFAVSSTDANMAMSMGAPAITISSGGTGHNAHSLDEWFDERGRTKDLAALGRLVFEVAG